MPDRRGADLLPLYREIDALIADGRHSPQFRRWHAATLDRLRRALGFHPAVVQFQGLRFRAGSVSPTETRDAAGGAAAEHDLRLRDDLAEARRILRTALGSLGLDPDKIPADDAAQAQAQPAQHDAAFETLARAVAGAAPQVLSAEAKLAAEEASARLAAALRPRQPGWAAVAEALSALLQHGPDVGKAAVAAVAARLPDVR